LKLKCDELLSNFAINVNVCHCNEELRQLSEDVECAGPRLR
jgi:hypothetical protein